MLRWRFKLCVRFCFLKQQHDVNHGVPVVLGRRTSIFYGTANKGLSYVYSNTSAIYDDDLSYDT